MVVNDSMNIYVVHISPIRTFEIDHGGLVRDIFVPIF